MSPDRSELPNSTAGQPPRFRVVAVASGLLTERQVADLEAESRRGPEAIHETTDQASWDKSLARLAVQKRLVTKFQARQMLLGRRRFTLGQYRILDEIGRGGMGQVFKAEHAMMGRVVAVKVLPRAKSTPETEAAFQREIRVLARLDHDNLVRELDAGHDGNVYYLVTEYVPGLDLRRQVMEHGPLDEPRAASVITQAARALAYAHDQGLVHRDVKPGNLLVTRDGRVKLLDLGLAGSVFEAESMRLGRCVGTMDYMAPEQIRDPDNVGPAADIYSLGCTLYFAVSGRLPFPGGDRKEKARRQLEATPAPIRTIAGHVSLPFARVIEAMMEKEPRDRIDSALEVIGLLKPWAPPTPMPMPRPQPEAAQALSATFTATGSPLGDAHGSDGMSPEDAAADGGFLESSATTSSGVDRGSGATWMSDGWQRSGLGDGRGILGRLRPLVETLARVVGVAGGAVVRLLALTGRGVEGPRILTAAVQSLLLAAPVGVAFGVAIQALSQINPEMARRMLRDASPWSLGWGAFCVIAAVQFLVAFGRRSRS